MAIHAKPGGSRIAVLGAVAALTLAACGGSSSSSSSEGGGGEPQAGGTLYYLTNAEQFDQIDPQRIAAGALFRVAGKSTNGSIASPSLSYKAQVGALAGPALLDKTLVNNAGRSSGVKFANASTAPASGEPRSLTKKGTPARGAALSKRAIDACATPSVHWLIAPMEGCKAWLRAMAMASSAGAVTSPSRTHCASVQASAST